MKTRNRITYIIIPFMALIPSFAYTQQEEKVKSDTTKAAREKTTPEIIKTKTTPTKEDLTRIEKKKIDNGKWFRKADIDRSGAGNRTQLACVQCKKGKYLAYDFLCKKFYRVTNNGVFKPANHLWKLRMTHNRSTQFRILNVNRYMYDVDLSVDNLEFKSETPELFNRLFLGVGQLEGLATKGDRASLKEGAKDPFAAFNEILRDFKKDYNGLVGEQLNAYKICTHMECTCGRTTVSFESLSDKLTRLRIAYLEVTQHVDKRVSNATDALNDANKKVQTCKEAAASKEKALMEEIRKLEQAARPDPTAINNKKNDLATLKESNKTACDPDDRAAEAAKKEKEQAQLEKERFENVWNVLSKLTDEHLMKLVLFNANMTSDHLTYISPTFYPQGNQARLSLRISPKDSAYSLATKWNTMPFYNDSISVDLPVVLKPYLGFSSGLFTLWGDRTRTTTYGWQPQPESGVVTDSARYILRPTGRTSNPVGFAANANVGIKLTGMVGLGITMGVGITIEDKPRPAYLGGFSLMLGAREQFNITWGWAGIRVNELRTELYSFEPTQYINTEELEYDKKLMAGNFVSVTYTIHTVGNSRGASSRSKQKK